MPVPLLTNLFALLILCAGLLFGAGEVALGSGRAATTGVARTASPSPTVAPRAIEGRDYSFMARVDGHPVHWPCATPIFVVLRGRAPTGTVVALTEVTSALREASGLDLRFGTTASSSAHIITVRYAPSGTVVGDLRLDGGQELGVGGPTWHAQDGVIDHADVLVRDDTQLSDPNSSTGRRVLMHEIGHALGLGHSAPDLPEVMGPTTSTDDTDQLGSGDRVALSHVGCLPR